MRPINADAYKEVCEKLRHRRIFPSARDERILRNYLDEFPTLDVRENVHGEWIEDWETGCSDCSHCGKGYLWEDYKGVADWEYCPNCGAKIDNRREIERGHYEVH